MKVLHSVQEFKQQKKFVAVTLGNFDGVHLGHQQLLRRAADAAKKKTAAFQWHLPLNLTLWRC